MISQQRHKRTCTFLSCQPPISKKCTFPLQKLALMVFRRPLRYADKLTQSTGQAQTSSKLSMSGSGPPEMFSNSMGLTAYCARISLVGVSPRTGVHSIMNITLFVSLIKKTINKIRLIKFVRCSSRLLNHKTGTLRSIIK